MRFTQYFCITMVVISAASLELSYNSLLYEKKELPTLLANIQSKLALINAANSINTAGINANTGALNNVQTQLNQVNAMNAATTNATYRNNARLDLFIKTFAAANAAFLTAMQLNTTNITTLITPQQTLVTSLTGL